MIAGVIFQGMGYSFMVSAMILFIRASTLPSELSMEKEESKMWINLKSPLNLDRILNLANIAAPILLIVGFSQAADSINMSSRAPGFESVDGTIKAGNIIYIIITLILVIMVANLVVNENSICGKVGKFALGTAVVCMLERCIFVAYLCLKSEPYHSNVVARIICQYAMEACTIFAFYVFTFYFPKFETSRKDAMVTY